MKSRSSPKGETPTSVGEGATHIDAFPIGEPHYRRLAQPTHTMTAIPDGLILLIVYGLAGFYTAVVYPWLGGGGRPVHDGTAGSERLGLSVVLGVLLLAVANNYLSPLLGSVWTAVALLALPLCHALFVAVRRGWQSLFAQLRPTLWRDVAASAVCALVILSIAHKLFFWRSLSTLGLLYPDLPWHIGRVAEQAFQSSPGFWPVSPIAFPGPLPFVSFVADSLVSASFRYLPTQIHAFNYSQVLFCWSIVLWTAVVLIAGSGPWRSLVVLTTAILAVPLIIWGIGRIGTIVFVFFLANPNSAIAWPVALALTLHLYRSYRRRSPPSWLFLVLIPPASLFIKANQAFAFGFLQLVGFVIWLPSQRYRSVLKCGVFVVCIWAGAILLSLCMGLWPISPGVHPSLANLRYYTAAAFPDQHSPPQLLTLLLSRLLMVAGVCVATVLMRSGSERTERTIGQAMRRDVVVPLAVLIASLAYVLVGWSLVVPSGLAEGEPMHVNIELIMWISTAIVSGAVCGLYERDRVQDRLHGARLFPAVFVSCFGLSLYGFMTWSLNYQPMQQGGIPLHYDYDIAAERQVRDLLKTQIPDGNCFWYRRRYAVYVGGPYDPDSVIAATGCPVINGHRWRGYLGDNRPDLLRGRQTIKVPWARPFRLIEIAPR